MSICRSCGAPITWVSTTKDKAMPVDAEPSEHGNLMIVDGTAHVVPTDTPQLQPVPLYRSHFVTCVHADAWRKK